jgi:hypothetical protein
LGGGGAACLQHIILRLLLWRVGATPPPRQYIAFLDGATDRLLLRKIGGYVFIHRLLLEYFATLEPYVCPPQTEDAEAEA